MQVELNAKQLFVIKLALDNLEPVPPELINETKQLIASSINLYPGKHEQGFPHKPNPLEGK